MNAINIKKQRGLSLVTLILVCVALVFVAIVGIKVAPEVIEYYNILKSVTATAQDPSSKDATVAQIRQKYDTRSSIDNVKTIKGADLDITKEGNEVVISFAYSTKIPLTGPVSLLIDFEGSSQQ